MLKEIIQTKEEIRIGRLCYEYKIKHGLELYENEIWKFIEGKDVEEYKDEYLVSNMGWLASYKKGKIRKVTRGSKTTDNNGNIYYIISLSNKNLRKNCPLHRLVAQVFCENDDPINKTIVNHIIERTEIECNDNAENLEWVTPQQNTLHSSYKITKVNKGRRGYGERRIRCVETGEIFDSLTKASKFIGVNHKTIHQAIKKGYKCHECYWEYVDKEELEPLQLENEIWKPIDGYEGLYEVSNLGRIKSLNYGLSGKSRILKQSKDKNGYMGIVLSKDNKRCPYKVHRLVALHFCEGYKEGLVVNHKNHIRDDNRACNLEWVTIEENNRHAYKNPNPNLNPKTQSVICLTTKEIFDSLKKGANKYNIKHQSISKCCNNDNNKSAGKLEDGTPLIWRYLNEDNNIMFLPSDYDEYVEKIAMIDKDTNEIIKVFDTQTDAGKYLGKNNINKISDCINGRCPTAYGYKWKRIKVKNTFIENANNILEEIKSKNNLEN